MEKIQNQEIYSVVGLEKNYLNLIVTVYKNSQFYTLFNERIYHNLNEGQETFTKIFQQGKLFNNLIQKAEKELKMVVREISYNLPVEKLKIITHEYFYKFNKPTLFNQAVLNNINQEFLKNYQDKNQYQNFLFKVNKYILLEQKEIFTKPPFGRTISSIKITGILYQVKWDQLYKYSEIFKAAQIKPLSPILFPYAVYINVLFSERKEQTLIIMWEEDKIQLFVFEKKIFTKFFEIASGLNSLIDKITNKLNLDKKDVKKYLYSVFDLTQINKTNHKLEFLHDLQGKQLKNIRKIITDNIINYFNKILNEVEFIIEEKLILNKTNTNIFIFGDVVKISGVQEYIQLNKKTWKIKIKINNFVGLKNNQDIYLIGNAYYRHLQNKTLLINNQSKIKRE